MDLPMIRNFEIYSQRHVEEMMCQAKHERTLAALRKTLAKPRQHSLAKSFQNSQVLETQLKECPISPDLWASHV